jgi:hypothetical protein
MVLMGADFQFSNAKYNYDHIEKILNYCNHHQGRNMTFVYSTPMRFMNALKTEHTVWPVHHDDFFPYEMDSLEYWTGYFTSRPGFKKQIKDYSSLYHSQAKVFA